MQIRVEVEVTPEELRRFLGLPDVAGLQDDIIGFLRDKVGAASDFDATAFVKNNFEVLKKIPAFNKIIARVSVAEPAGKPKAKRRKAAARKPRKAAEAPPSDGGEIS